MTNYARILMVSVSVGAFFHATKELFSSGDDAATVTLRGRRLLQDPRTVTMKPDYAQLQSAAAGNMGTLSQNSPQNFGQQVQHAEAETTAVDSILQTVAGMNNNMANDNSLMSNQLSGAGGLQQAGDLSSMSGAMSESSTGASNGLGSSLLSQQQDLSSNSLSQQGSSMEQQQLGGQTMTEQGRTGSVEQQGQQQGSDSTMMGQQQQQDPYGSSMGTQTSSSGEARKLEFIHVTKSGGSAVEKIAAENSIMWGACHYWKIPYLGCATPDWDFPKKRRVDRMPSGLHYQGEPWHAPPHWNDPNMMEDSDTFLIIRYPYDRIISEYYCSAFGYKGEGREDPAVFNEWLASNLALLDEKLQGHMLPQHYYVYDENGMKVVNHIVRYENMQPEFDALMEQYNLPIRMPEKSEKTTFHYKKQDSRGKKVADDAKKMTINDISPENIQKMNEVYARDFEFFGYVMITTTPSMSEGQGGTLNPDSLSGAAGSGIFQGQTLSKGGNMSSNGGEEQQQQLMTQGGSTGMMSNGGDQQQQQLRSQGGSTGMMSNEEDQQLLRQSGASGMMSNDLQQLQMLSQDGSTGLSDPQMFTQRGSMSNGESQQKQTLSQDGSMGVSDPQLLGSGSTTGALSSQQQLMGGQQIMDQKGMSSSGSTMGMLGGSQLSGLSGDGMSQDSGMMTQQQASSIDQQQMMMPEDGSSTSRNGSSLSSNTA